MSNKKQISIYIYMHQRQTTRSYDVGGECMIMYFWVCEKLRANHPSGDHAHYPSRKAALSAVPAPLCFDLVGTKQDQVVVIIGHDARRHAKSATNQTASLDQAVRGHHKRVIANPAHGPRQNLRHNPQVLAETASVPPIHYLAIYLRSGRRVRVTCATSALRPRVARQGPANQVVRRRRPDLQPAGRRSAGALAWAGTLRGGEDGRRDLATAADRAAPPTRKARWTSTPLPPAAVHVGNPTKPFFLDCGTESESIRRPPSCSCSAPSCPPAVGVAHHQCP